MQPTITPAFSVAGALLILTGVLYTLIGIKTKWLHVYLSAAYLFALAVTILILYVMHPPVSNGIQGAYFVAAAVTGMIAGAVAVLFSDVTEGLGCFLGGFCLSMWFLVLKPGGLLTSTAGKAIFIACFTVATFSLYLSHYTRPYGLIASTSFAGATIVLLGVDMFSRAGLKEFWAYIWGLNSDLFPQNYAGPYPITRGMRVEIASIVLLSILGVMAQMKVWKIIRQKRQERAVEQLRKDAEQDLAEEDLGRRLEAGNERDLAMWDAVYGGKKSTVSGIDSGIGTDEPSSTRKGSLNMVDVREVPEGIELQNVQGSQKGSQKGGRLMVHVAQDDGVSEVPSLACQQSTESLPRSWREPSIQESRTGNSKPMASETSSIRSQNKTPHTKLDPALSLKPKFVPLPFHVPVESSQRDDEVSSVDADAASVNGSVEAPNRQFRSSLLRKLSGRSQRNILASTASEEALVIPYAENDRASSVAATMDGISAHSSSGDPQSSRDDTYSQSPKIISATGQDFSRSEVSNTENPALHGATSPALTEWPLAGGASAAQDLSLTDPRVPTQKPSHEESEQRAQTAHLGENLPNGASKVVMAYRTNEWAKHLDRADSPQFDEIPLPKTKPSLSTISIENPTPVNIQALQQTALTAEPAPLNKKIGSDKGSRAVHSNQPPSPQSPLGISMGRNPSQTSLSSTNSKEDLPRPPLPRARSSQASLAPARGFRSSSSPLAGIPLVESPIEEGVESTFPNRFTPSTTHLISKRDNLIQTRASSTSLLRVSSAGPSSSALQALDEDDNIPLSQRRSILQQNPQMTSQSRHTSSGSSTPNRISRNPSGSSTPQLQTQILSHNSSRISVNPTNPPHVARPAATPRSSAAISAWHASLQPSSQAVYQHQEIEQRRSDLLAEKRRQSSTQTQAQIAQGRRESVLDRGMRRGSMLDAHREAMRKMQGKANKTLKPGPS